MRHTKSQVYTYSAAIVAALALSVSFAVFGWACPPMDFLRSINSVNPMQLAFLESFDVLNNTGADVEIMPIGMFAGDGSYGPLPRHKDRFPPAVPLTSATPIVVGAGSQARVTYDYDDVNFRHVLIRTRDGRIYILDTDKRGTRDACYGPQKQLYVIRPLKELRIAPREILPCFDGTRVAYSEAKEYE